MAIVQNPIIGRARKSTGGIRFCSWNGLNIMATKPMEVRQNVTPAVELNRSKMSVVGKFVSKLGQFSKDAYSLGIAKTTPFADTVKFFRTKMLDSLKLDVNLLKDSSFGTGNVAVGEFACVNDDAGSFEVELSFDNSIWGVDSIDVSVIIFNDIMTKVGFFSESVSPTGSISKNLSKWGFVQGDNIYFGIKPVKYKPGADLSGKVKMCNSNGFITLT